MKTKKQRNPRTIYQKLSSQRNYTRFFMLKTLTLGNCPDIVKSTETYILLQNINAQINLLKTSFDADWLRTKNILKGVEAEDDVPF